MSYEFTAYASSDGRPPKLKEVPKEGVLTQKTVVQEFFQHAKGNIARLLKNMHGLNNFNMQGISHSPLNRWSSGGGAVVSNAGYASSPYRTMGASLLHQLVYAGG